MLIYKKIFQLREGLTFSNYIHELSDEAFPPYVLDIEKTLLENVYRLQPIFMFQPGQMGVILFPGGMLINDCIIEYSNDEREFTLLGSIRGLNLIMGLLFIMPPLALFLFAFFWMFTAEMSSDNFIVFMLLTIVTLVPLTSTFFREKKLLDRIGLFGLVINKE